MIGYRCYTCNEEHRHRGECPYDYDDVSDSSESHRNYTSVSIPSNMGMNETITVYVSGKYITLKRTG